MKKRSYEIDMCNGPLLKKILIFSVPLMLSGILQLLFNAADIIVVGQFTGKTALAAVGATSSLYNLIVNIFIGLSAGVSILVARYYGAQEWKNVGESVHTSMLLSLLSGLILIFAGIFITKPMLELMDTPSDVIGQSVLYLRIIFLGMPAQMVYNFGAAILRAVGDTQRPLIFLFISGVINVLLNLFFVIVFSLGVAGVAIATIISQYFSAVMVMLCLIKTDKPYRLRLSKLRIKKDKLLSILRVGLPAGIQGSLFSVSNMLIQSSVNSFGTAAIAGNTASSNIEGFIYTAMNSLYHASLNFTSQNVGAGKLNRVMPIFRRCLGILFVVGSSMGAAALLFGRQLLGIYTPDPEVVPYGLLRLGIIAPTYFFCGFMEVACGSVRGLGAAVTPTAVSLAGACGLRILWIYTVFRAEPTLTCLYLSYPISWALTFAVHFICLIFFLRTLKKKAAERLSVKPAEENEAAPPKSAASQSL